MQSGTKEKYCNWVKGSKSNTVAVITWCFGSTWSPRRAYFAQNELSATGNNGNVVTCYCQPMGQGVWLDYICSKHLYLKERWDICSYIMNKGENYFVFYLNKDPLTLTQLGNYFGTVIFYWGEHVSKIPSI